MTIKNFSQQQSKDRKSVNPADESFDFALWSKAVRSQMIQTLARKVRL